MRHPMAEAPHAPAAPRPDVPQTATAPALTPAPDAAPAREIGGPKGPEPTRYGDWERNGRCIDF